jgi:hypothetical protein
MLQYGTVDNIVDAINKEQPGLCPLSAFYVTKAEHMVDVSLPFIKEKTTWLRRLHNRWYFPFGKDVAYSYRPAPSPFLYVTGRNIYGHPETIAKLEERLCMFDKDCESCGYPLKSVAETAICPQCNRTTNMKGIENDKTSTANATGQTGQEENTTEETTEETDR